MPVLDVCAVRERQFDIAGMRICAREWGEGNQPVMALHGWLDNAASFDVLAPLLDGMQLLALDLPGHGLSDHKPAHGSYNIWDDLLIILAVADAMGWQRFTLIGHSRGAIIAMLLAVAAPERVKYLIALDGLLPLPVSAAQVASQLADYVREYRKLYARPARGYPDIQQMIDARRQAMPMTEAAATLLVSRGVLCDDGNYYWRNDPRLKAASAFKLGADHCDALLKSLAMPSLVILAEAGFGGNEDFRGMLGNYPGLRIECLPGGHHQHMEAQASEVATLINAALKYSGSPNSSTGVST